MLVLQEIKQVSDAFPADELAAAGYESVANGQKTYNGVATLSRTSIHDPVTEFPDFHDPQRRVLATTIAGVRIVNLYVPNGQAVGSDKYDYKLEWLARVTDWIEAEMGKHEKVVVMGDFNIAPEDRDVHDPEAWHERILCSTPEREALARITGLGLADTFRLFEQEEKSWSWWDYRQAAFRRNMGLRIDLVLASKALEDACSAAYIDVEPRRQERPSDHTPVIAEFDL